MANLNYDELVKEEQDLDGVAPDEVDDAVTPDEGEAEVDPNAAVLEELKALRTDYQDIAKRMNAARKRGEDTSEFQMDMNDIRSAVASLTDALTNSDVFDDDTKATLSKNKQTAEIQRATRSVYNHYKGEIDEVLDEAGLTWEDARFEKARSLWQSNPAEAAKIARREAIAAIKASATPAAVEPEGKPAMDEAEVQKRVDAALKKAGVYTQDTGGSSARGGADGDEAFVLAYAEGESDDHARMSKLLAGMNR